ncbi:MAG: serine protease [Acidobacteria bacterium]|nr:serine protease [Acidobacteriota bacterium]
MIVTETGQGMLAKMQPWCPSVALCVSGLFGFGVAPALAQATVEYPSLMTTPVYLFNGTRQVSQGTGFFYGVQNAAGVVETVFLVTNYHVVTGHSPGVASPPKGDRVIFYLHLDKNEPSAVKQVALPLYNDVGTPLWEQSTEQPEADVILLPIPPPVYAGIAMWVFDENHIRPHIRIRPTSSATLLGYPYGFSDTTNRLPVWKTGSVASEPQVDFQGKPAFLVDVSAFPGMSGSPVLAVANGVYEDDREVMRTGRVVRLLGVFSAMPVIRSETPGQADTSLQLGYVWKAALIADLARAYRPR